MNVLEESLKIIQRFEGLRLKAYLDVVGVWTCGWGSTGPDITPTTIWTREQADARLTRDVLIFSVGVQTLMTGISDYQLVAMIDFAYNLGLTRLKASTLRRKFLRRDIQGTADEFKKWTHAGGKVLPALVFRREIERTLFLSGSR